MKKIVYSIVRLKKYIRLMCKQKEVRNGDILQTNESLKSFGKIGNEHFEDIMTMVAKIEYDFMSTTNYSEDQVLAVKSVLAEVIKFFQGCGKEWSEYEEEQACKNSKDH